MTRQEATALVHKIILQQDPVYFQGIKEEDVLSDNFDSLEIIEMGMELENEVGVSIPDEVMETWKTVRNVIDTIETLNKA